MNLSRKWMIEGRRWKVVLSFVILTFSFFTSIQPSLAVAPLTDGNNYSQDFQTPAPCVTSPNNPCSVNLDFLQSFIQKLIGLIVPLALIAALFMLSWAGIKFLTSGGEQAALKSARETATWAMVGILFLIIAWLVLLLVHAFTGVDVLNFSIGFGSGVSDPCAATYGAGHGC